MVKRKAVILAAGQSSRMKTEQSKVLHEVCGRPMLEYVLDACRTADIDQMIVVVGYGKDQVIDRYGDQDDIVFVEQAEQNGTGHAVICAKEHLEGFDGQTIILCGDTPLLRPETVKTLIEKHESEKSAVTLATTILDEPTGYGRIVRDEYGNMQGIVEENDCTDEQRKIQEINPAYYCFDTPVLIEALGQIKNDNAKGEYYLTDALHIAIAAGHKAVAVTALAAEDAMGVNTRFQLSIASKIMQGRIQEWFMDNGVTIVDPANTWIDVRTTIGQDTVIEPFTYIHGKVIIGKNCRIGPFAHLHDDVEMADEVKTGVFYKN